MSKEAMQMALEALEDANDVARMEFSDEDYYSEAIKTLRQALETEQEPVAWMFVNEDGECEQIEYGPVFDDPGVTPLYASPPKREWVGLTEDDVHDAFNYVEMVKLLDFDRHRPDWCEAFASACEATLRHKNGGNK